MPEGKPNHGDWLAGDSSVFFMVQRQRSRSMSLLSGSTCVTCIGQKKVVPAWMQLSFSLHCCWLASAELRYGEDSLASLGTANNPLFSTQDFMQADPSI